MSADRAMYKSLQDACDVIIPVFNEQESIREICKRVQASVPGGRITVVDDGSTDGTWGELAEFASRPDFCLLRHIRNRGKCSAIRTGLQQVTAPYVIIQDADLEYDPNDYSRLLSPLLAGRADVVYGSRYVGHSLFRKLFVEGVDAAIGLLAVRALNLAVRAIYGLRVTDEATCYKAFKTDDLRRMELESERFEFCPEVTAKTARLRLRFAEVPISYQRRSRSDGKKIRARDGWVALATLWRYRNWRPQQKRQPPVGSLVTTPQLEKNAGHASFGARRLRAKGFTLVELLVVVGIVALLVTLLLPAVQAAREAARRTQCVNQIKQLSLACIQHEGTHNMFPTDGWGWRWVGDPDMGFARQQPGGWIYNTLPFMEQTELRTLGQGQGVDGKLAASEQLLTTPLPTMTCPSRREALLYPFTPAAPFANARPLEKMAKADYACNAGSVKMDTGTGPENLTAKAIKAYEWPDPRRLTGVMFAFSEIGSQDIVDGLSKTYLIGEKYLSNSEYTTGTGFGGDDQTMYMGDDADVRRWTHVAPLPDRAKTETRDPFGGPHRSGVMLAFCDGSVRSVAYDVELPIHQTAGNREDGY